MNMQNYDFLFLVDVNEWIVEKALDIDHTLITFVRNQYVHICQREKIAVWKLHQQELQFASVNRSKSS